MTTRLDRVRREMKRRRITQADLAAALEVAPRTVGRILNGEREIPETLWLIEDHLGLPHSEPGPDEDKDEVARVSDVQRLSDGMLWARIHELTAEAQRRLAEARSDAARADRGSPAPGGTGSLPRDLRPSRDTDGGTQLPKGVR